MTNLVFMSIKNDRIVEMTQLLPFTQEKTFGAAPSLWNVMKKCLFCLKVASSIVIEAMDQSLRVPLYLVTSSMTHHSQILVISDEEKQ